MVGKFTLKMHTPHNEIAGKKMQKFILCCFYIHTILSRNTELFSFQ